MTDRLSMLHEWLRVDLDMANYELAPASQDASFRRYFRIVSSETSYIVMDAPPEKEDCTAFLSVTERLQKCDVNVPEVFARNLRQGFLLLSDLGTELYLDKLNDENADGLYSDAIRTIVKMQTGGSVKDLPAYNLSLLMQEMNLFRDWLVEKHCRLSLNEAELKQLELVFQLLTESALKQTVVFVHRDFHSRNLLLNKINPGVIDYQDAISGPQSYDLVSLLKDCYIKWPLSKIDAWFQLYYDQASESADLEISRDEFKRGFDLMGVQRHLKASGIFARLNHRDGKTDYLRDIPRTLSYIVELENDYPELKMLIELLLMKVLPALERK
jgi:hypothetical protein